MARRRAYPPQALRTEEERPPAYVPLDRVRIVETALQLLDEIGLQALSMKKIADKLEVKTASLYYHVKDKEQLMQLLTDKISGEMVWPEASLPWEEQIRQWARRFRSVLIAHRDAAELFNRTIAVGCERLTQIERLYRLLVASGFPDAQVPWVASLLKNYVLSFAAEEVRLNDMAEEARSAASASGSAREEADDRYGRFYRQLPAERFPHMVRLAAYTARSNGEEEFAFGLDVLIAGLTARLPQGSA